MSDTNDAASRTEEPTPRRLQQAREKGEVVRTPDLPSVASLMAVAGVVVLGGGWLSRNLTNALRPFIAQPDAMRLDGGDGVAVARMAIEAAAPAVGAVILAAAVAGVFGNVIQTGLMFAPERLAFDLSKLSLGAGVRRVFG